MVAVAAGQGFVVAVPGPAAAVIIAGSAPGLFARMDADAALDDEEVQGQWRSVAQQAAAAGVQRRQAGELGPAYELARLGLFLAVRVGDPRGVAALAGNAWSVADAVRDVLLRGLAPERGPDAGPEWDAEVERQREELEWVRETVVADARALLPEVAALADRDPAEPDTALAVHRLAALAGVAPARAAAVERLAATRDEDAQLLAATEELTCAGELEVLVLAHLIDEPDERGLVDAWERYVALRHLIPEGVDAPAALAGRLASAFRHFAFLRLRQTTAGGAFGHRLSYAVSQFLQSIGRDLVALLLRLGHDEEALGVAEGLLARSMVDWMSRTHGVWRPARETRAAVAPLTGWGNAGDVLDAAEVRAVAGMAESCILVYLRHPGGLHAWLVLPAGELLSEDLGDVPVAVDPVLAQLPYVAPRGADRTRDARAPAAAAPKDLLDGRLRELHDVLIPAAFDEALSGQRLAIVADPALNVVPFAALRTPRERYLVQERTLVSWPSITSWLVVERGARLPAWSRAHRDGPVPPLVLGKSTFDPECEVAGERLRFGPLPGARAEATAVGALIGAEPLLDDDATVGALMQRGSGAEVIHLATHGFLDDDDPMASFVVLSDGMLKASELYAFDPGVRAGVVVLSACRTGLGGGHPDSLVGLRARS